MQHSIPPLIMHNNAVAQHRRQQSRQRSTNTTIPFLLLLASLLLSTHAQNVLQADDDCQNNLYNSDSDGDRRVDQEEYVTFLKLEGPDDFLPGVESFVQLPIMLQSNFYTLACLCRTLEGNTGSGCCVGDSAHLNTNGTAPGETPTEEQEDYLNLVCGLTARAIESAVEEQTDSPTEFVTEAPSTSPSSSPTAAPVPGTPSPTIATDSPTTAPTLAPTDAPIDAPSTFAPTITAAPSSFFEPVPVIIKTTYSILVPNGMIEDVPQSLYEPDLIDSMDLVAQDVAGVLNDNTGRVSERRQLQQPQTRRRLEILVDLPTTLDSIENVGYTTTPQLIEGKFLRGPCPLDVGDPTRDLCEEVAATIELTVTSEDDNPLLVYGLFSAALDRAILSGDLVAALEEVNPNAVIEIASGQSSTGGTTPPTQAPTSGSTEEDKRGLSAGAIGGITAASIFMIGAIWFVISQQREFERRYQEKRARAKAHSQGDPEAPMPVEGYDSDGNDSASGQLSEKAPSKGKKKQTQPDHETTATLASTTADSRDSVPVQSNLGQQLHEPEEEKRTEEEEMEDDAAAMLAATMPYDISPNADKPEPKKFEFVGSDDLMHDNNAPNIPHEARSTGNISHESEAGWSEAYTSSMGSVSDDELLPDQVGSQDEPKMILSISEDSPLGQGSPKGDDSEPENKFAQLENAIMAGDWAAVGATAAALAGMQEGQSTADISKSSTGLSAISSLRSRSWKNKIDSRRAEDLDKLIEAGDWEGIILAAATYEAHENGATNVYNLGNASVPSSNGSQNELMVHEDGSDSEGDETGFYSAATSKSSASRQRTKAEYRATIIDLVNRVVPEEVDHVDEMLEQFVGREDELIETLETMQERAEAQSSVSGRSAKSLFKGTIDLN